MDTVWSRKGVKFGDQRVLGSGDSRPSGSSAFSSAGKPAAKRMIQLELPPVRSVCVRRASASRRTHSVVTPRRDVALCSRAQSAVSSCGRKPRSAELRATPGCLRRVQHRDAPRVGQRRGLAEPSRMSAPGLRLTASLPCLTHLLLNWSRTQGRTQETWRWSISSGNACVCACVCLHTCVWVRSAPLPVARLIASFRCPQLSTQTNQYVINTRSIPRQCFPPRAGLIHEAHHTRDASRASVACRANGVVMTRDSPMEMRQNAGRTWCERARCVQQSAHGSRSDALTAEAGTSPTTLSAIRCVTSGTKILWSDKLRKS